MASKKDMVIKIAPDQVMFSNISKSKDGYNSARVVAKVSDNEYMSVSYEWEGTNVPDFAMNLMSFMQANSMELGMVAEYADDTYACKTCQEHNPELYDKDGKLKSKKAKSDDEDAAKNGKKPPFWKKDDDEEKDGDDKKKDKKDDKKKDKKSKKKEKSDTEEE